MKHPRPGVLKFCRINVTLGIVLGGFSGQPTPVLIDVTPGNENLA
jgi:hypothetical protein